VPAARHLITAALAAAALVVTPAAAHGKTTPHGKHKGPKATIALGDKRPSKARARASITCANTDVLPTADNIEQIRAAVLCLHNQIRQQHNLPLLKDNAKLRKAANGHSSDMVDEGYFDHTTPGGTNFVDRIIGAGYVKRNDAWTLGENLAWGTGDLSTADGVMQAWMNSAGHKANILKRSYKEVGIGIRLGVPSDGGVGATFTADFGAKG
jgi:uncharacterized protein YkwD